MLTVLLVAGDVADPRRPVSARRTDLLAAPDRCRYLLERARDADRVAPGMPDALDQRDRRLRRAF